MSIRKRKLQTTRLILFLLRVRYLKQNHCLFTFGIILSLGSIKEAVKQNYSWIFKHRYFTSLWKHIQKMLILVSCAVTDFDLKVDTSFSYSTPKMFFRDTYLTTRRHNLSNLAWEKKVFLSVLNITLKMERIYFELKINNYPKIFHSLNCSRFYEEAVC